MEDERRRRPDRRTTPAAPQGSDWKTARNRVAQKVLVAEPDAALGELYRSALESDGWTVDVVNDRTAALDRAIASQPGVVLLSTTRDLTATTLLKRIRNHRSTRNLPVIVLTNSADEADHHGWYQMGVLGWLIKSRQMRARLSETITRLLERRTSARDRRVLSRPGR